MASSQAKGIIYTFPGHVHGYKGRIAAQYSGAPLTVANETQFRMNDTNRSEEYVKKFPTGKVPAYENDDNVYLFECGAISYYLGNEQLRGKTVVEQAEVYQWMEYSEREIIPVSAVLVYPCMGILQFNKNNHEHATFELKQILHVLNEFLRTRTYLVGQRITLADITVACDLLQLFHWIIDPSTRETYPNVTRWFLTLIHQKEFRTVIGNDFQLCERTAQPDPKRYAELSQTVNVPQTQPGPKNFSQPSNEKQAAGKAKKEKPAKHQEQQKQQEKPPKKSKEPEPKEDDGEADETDDIHANEPKQKDPFADMPKSTFNMDEFKRVYSNEDTATKAIPYFWQNFDKDNCSIWFCEYKYPEDLSQVFMTCNLISGFFQRLDKLRKHAFASMCVFGENNNNTIAGLWVWRGQQLAFELSSDWQVDYESYSWKKLSADDEETKKLVNQYFLWEVEHNGKKFNQGKIFK